MTRKPAERDLQLLANVSGAGMMLRPDEIAGAAGMDREEVDRRLKRLEARGLVKFYVSATTEGAAIARRASGS